MRVHNRQARPHLSLQGFHSGEGHARTVSPRRIHAGDGRNGDDCAGGALLWRRRPVFRRPDFGGDRAPVLFAGRAAVARGNRRCRRALAAAPGDLRHHLCPVPARGPRAAAAGFGFVGAGDGARPAIPVHPAFDRAVFDRVHFDCRRQRRRGLVQRLRVKPRRHGSRPRCWPASYCRRMVDFHSMRCARSPSS